MMGSNLLRAPDVITFTGSVDLTSKLTALYLHVEKAPHAFSKSSCLV